MTPTNRSSSHELLQIEAEFRAGRISDAVSRAIAFLDETADPVARANCAGVLIDFGAATERADLVTKAIACLDALRVWYESRCPAQVYYNLGNGWDALGRLEVRSLASTDRWQCEAFQKAKACHREALRASSSVPDAKRTQYIVNYANLLSSMWRGLEAIKAYDQALALDSSFGMALCNKALAVRFFAGVSGAYGGAILAWAWQMLQRGLEDPRIDRVGAEGARVGFEKGIAAIEAKVAKSDLLSTPLAHPPEDLSDASALERLYVHSCAAEHLFLNVHIHENECRAATVDNVFTVRPVPVTDRFIGLERSLSQMIEDFSTARYL